MAFEDTELEQLAAKLYRAIGTQNTDRGEIVRLCRDMLRQNALLFHYAKAGARSNGENNCRALHFDFNCISTRAIADCTKHLTLILTRLSVLFCNNERFSTSHCYASDRDKAKLYAELVRQMESKLAKLTILRDYTGSIYWLEQTGITCRICTLPKQLDFLLFEDIWSREIPYILTSGTLSVGGDFTHIKRNIGIALCEPNRATEISKASPFDYMANALLYLPAAMPFPDVKNAEYMQAAQEQIAALIAGTYGHTLILFTSYRMMERIFATLQEHITAYPLFMMGKGRLNVLDDFRKSGNGILFADVL